MLKRFFKFTGILLLLLLSAGALKAFTAGEIPPLKDGDLIFQTSLHPQSKGVVAASLSSLSHVGIVKHTPEGMMVVDSGSVVRTVPLQKWIASGLAGRVEIYRYKALTDALGKKLVKNAERYTGKPYDIYFLMGADEIYCSELIWLAYKDADIPVGKIEKVSDLAINNRYTQQLMEQRWKSYPPCAKIKDFESCKKIILEQELVTPVSIADDAQFERIYSNYPY